MMSVRHRIAAVLAYEIRADKRVWLVLAVVLFPLTWFFPVPEKSDLLPLWALFIEVLRGSGGSVFDRVACVLCLPAILASVRAVSVT